MYRGSSPELRASERRIARDRRRDARSRARIWSRYRMSDMCYYYMIIFFRKKIHKRIDCLLNRRELRVHIEHVSEYQPRVKPNNEIDVDKTKTNTELVGGRQAEHERVGQRTIGGQDRRQLGRRWQLRLRGRRRR
jgi:hypothetical protein